MAQLNLAKKLKNLGATFLVDKTSGDVFVTLPGKFGRAKSTSRLRQETESSLKNSGLSNLIKKGEFKTQEQILGAGGAARAISHPSGDVDSLDILGQVVDDVFQNVEQALKAQPSGTIAIGNENISRSDAQKLIGKTVDFSQAAQDAQAAAGEAAAASLDASLAEQDGVITEPSVTSETFSLDIFPDPTLAQTVQETSADLIANPEFVNAAFQAFHGRDANQAELDEFVGRNTGEIRGIIRAGSPVSQAQVQPGTGVEQQFTPEQLAAADALAEAAANSDLIYKPQVSPEDIDEFVSTGIERATEELDPFFSEQIGRGRDAFIQSIGFETQARQRELEAQELREQKELRAARGSLEERGATFSGEAAELLGEESALPTRFQTVLEGLLPKQQGLIASAAQQRFAERIAGKTQTAEELLGTQAVQDITGDITNPVTQGLFQTLGTPTPGSIARARETAIQTRGRELAGADVVSEVATSEEFPQEQLTQFI